MNAEPPVQDIGLPVGESSRSFGRRGDAADRRVANGIFRATLSSSWLTWLAGSSVLLLVVLALVGVAWVERADQIERVGERSELMARVLADSVTRNIEGAALATLTLSDLLERGLAPDSVEVRAAMAQTLVNLPFVRGIGVVDARGRVIGSTQPGERGLQLDMSRFGELPGAGRDRLGGFVPGRLLADLAAGASVTPAGVGFMPLLRGLNVSGAEPMVLVTLLNTEAFVNFQQITLNDTSAAAALLSYDGYLIGATSEVPRANGSSVASLAPFVDFLPRLEHGQWVGTGLRPGRQVAAFRTSSSRPLIVMVEFDHASLIAVWWQRTRGLLAAGLAAVLVIVAMTALAARSVRARELARRQLDAAQNEVARRERELSITMRSLQELIFRTDARGAITFVNQQWQALTGGEPDDALGRLFWELVTPEHRELAISMFVGDLSQGVRNLQAVFAEPGGGQRTFDISVMPLQRGGKITGFAGSAMDVTERVRAGQKLQTQLAFTELLMETSPLPLAVTDLAGRHVMVNQAWEAFTGCARSMVIGHPGPAGLQPAQHQAHLMRDRQLLEQGGLQRFEDSFIQRDGSERDLIVNKALLRGVDGRPTGILTLYIDVTEFRNAERATREARDAAEEASRSKSEFIANISHELRTPLQSIIGFSELGLIRSKEQPRLNPMFADILAGGQRMLALVNDLLDVSKIESAVGTMHLETHDLRMLVREVLRELDPMLAQRQLQVRLQLQQQPLLARVDPTRYAQVLRNVLANAVKFSPVGGVIELTADETPHGEPRISVADRGPGIPADEIERIFEAFVQSSLTKDGSGGTGLGLAISRKIVQAHGGYIVAAGRAGGGAVFQIVLPIRGQTETQPMPL